MGRQETPEFLVRNKKTTKVLKGDEIDFEMVKTQAFYLFSISPALSQTQESAKEKSASEAQEKNFLYLSSWFRYIGDSNSANDTILRAEKVKEDSLTLTLNS